MMKTLDKVNWQASFWILYTEFSTSTCRFLTCTCPNNALTCSDSLVLSLVMESES